MSGPTNSDGGWPLLQLFWVPGLRHLWHWLGMRPVSKAVIQQLLRSGTSIALCPGGVAECLHMRHGVPQPHASPHISTCKPLQRCPTLRTMA